MQKRFKILESKRFNEILNQEINEIETKIYFFFTHAARLDGQWQQRVGELLLID